MEYKIGEKHGFDKTQVDELKNLAVNMSGRATKKFLSDFVNYVAERDGLLSADRATVKKSPELSARLSAYKKLAGKIDKLAAPEQSWCMQFQIEGIDDFMLCYQVAVVTAEGFRIDIHVPPQQHPRFMYELDNLTNLTRNYYKSALSQSGIGADLANLLPDVDVSDLRVNEYNRSMYIDEAYKKRLGVVCYYVDKEGNPIQVVDNTGNPIVIPEHEK